MGKGEFGVGNCVYIILTSSLYVRKKKYLYLLLSSCVGVFIVCGCKSIRSQWLI